LANTVKLQLPLIAGGQAQKHVTHNEALLLLDALVSGGVVSSTVTAQPGSPAEGDLYAIGATHTGAVWASFANHTLAYYRDNAWVNITPREGWRFYDQANNYDIIFNGSAWEDTGILTRVAKAGDTMTGALRLHVNASGALGPKLEIANFGAGAAAGGAIDYLGAGSQPIHCRITNVDDGSFSSDLIFQLKTSGASGNGLFEALRFKSNNKITVGSGITFGSTATFSGTFPSSGNGLELASVGSDSYIQAYNRDGAAWRNLYFGGAVINFLVNSSNVAYLTSAGLKISVGSTIEFIGSGGPGVLQEGWGIRYTGGANHPFQISTAASLVVGINAGGAGYGTGNIYCSGTLTQSYSDDRFKTRKGRIENALEKLLSIEGFLYEENDLARSFGYDTRGLQVGVSAQAVLKVQPEAVKLAAFDYDTDADGNPVSKSGQNYLTVDYPRLAPLQIEATRELTARVVYLEQQIVALLRQQKGG
jgi:hypothetical protein